MLSRIFVKYNKKYNDSISEDKIDTYEFSHMLNPLCKNIFEEFATTDLIMSTEVAEGAVDALTYLSKYHDIYFVTAGHPYTAPARDDWLGKTFGWYRSSHLIVCRQKQLLKVDVMIDDYENNLIGGMYAKILMTRNWNKQFAAEAFGIKRIFSWKEVPKIIQELGREYT